MALEKYSIVVNGLKAEDVVAQLRAIKTFPCTIRIQDRVMMMDSQEEILTFADGLDTGWYLSEEASAT